MKKAKSQAKTFTTLNQAAADFGSTVPKVRRVLMEVGVLDAAGKPRLALLESGDAEPRTLDDGTPWFALETSMVVAALNWAGLYELDDLAKKCYVRNRHEAKDLLNKGVCAIGASLGFDINKYPTVLGDEEAWAKICQLLPTEVAQKMAAERQAQERLHGFGHWTMDTLVYCHHGDPDGRCFDGIFEGALVALGERTVAVATIETVLNDLLEKAGAMAPGMTKASWRQYREGLAMIEAVKSWLMKPKAVAA
jgi:hypothetical protein